jgi:hypothetical protein
MPVPPSEPIPIDNNDPDARGPHRQGDPMSMRCRICDKPRVQHWSGGVLIHIFCAVCDAPNANGDVFHV